MNFTEHELENLLNTCSFWLREYDNIQPDHMKAPQTTKEINKLSKKIWRIIRERRKSTT